MLFGLSRNALLRQEKRCVTSLTTQINGLYDSHCIDDFVNTFVLGQVVLDVAKTRSPIPFVIQWISRHIPDIEKWRTFIPDTQHSPNQAAVNELLNQFFSNSAFPARYSQTCRNH